MADNSNSNGSSFTASLLGTLATIAVFAVLVFLAYGLNDKNEVMPTGDEVSFPTGASIKAKDAETLNSYGWVDKEKGIVRIPADLAADLVIQELSQ